VLVKKRIKRKNYQIEKEGEQIQKDRLSYKILHGFSQFSQEPSIFSLILFKRELEITMV